MESIALSESPRRRGTSKKTNVEDESKEYRWEAIPTSNHQMTRDELCVIYLLEWH